MKNYKKHLTIAAIIAATFLNTACTKEEKLSLKEHTEKYGYDGLNIKPSYPDSVKDVPIENWRLTESGRYAHSLKYEHLINKPFPYQFDNNRKYGLEKEKYFEHLCKTEGKEYIFETAENVETIAVLRNIENPPNPFGKNFTTDDYLRNMYALEAPLIYDQNYALAVKMEHEFEGENNKYFGERYAFRFQTHFTIKYKETEIVFNDGKVIRYTYNEEKSKEEKRSVIDVKKINNITAKYGITWRGFKRERDREFGLAGSDLIIINLETGKIAAIQRNFMRGSMYPKAEGLYWWGSACPDSYRNRKLSKLLYEKNITNKIFAFQELILRAEYPHHKIHRPFIEAVLKPKKQ